MTKRITNNVITMIIKRSDEEMAMPKNKIVLYKEIHEITQHGDPIDFFLPSMMTETKIVRIFQFVMTESCFIDINFVSLSA